MPLTPENLIRHELNGLPVEVVTAANPDLVGIAGRIVVETMRTFHVDTGTRVRQVPKEGATFEFCLPAPTADGRNGGDAATPEHTSRTDEAAETAKVSGTASELVSTPVKSATDTGSYEGSVEATRDEAGEGVAYVTVDGAQLLSRPALRTENAGESTWR